MIAKDTKTGDLCDWCKKQIIDGDRVTLNRDGEQIHDTWCIRAE